MSGGGLDSPTQVKMAVLPATTWASSGAMTISAVGGGGGGGGRRGGGGGEREVEREGEGGGERNDRERVESCYYYNICTTCADSVKHPHLLHVPTHTLSQQHNCLQQTPHATTKPLKPAMYVLFT